MEHIISALVISLWLITGISNAQDITNTLAPNGSFKIKDGTTDYFILNQANGTVGLPSPLAGNQRGSIFKGNDSFLHTYQGTNTFGYNTFLGINAGNFTMSGSGNEASYNTGVGYQSLAFLTTGESNSAFGYRSLFLNTTGGYNSAFGLISLYFNTTGIANSAFGSGSLYANDTGNWNSAFGNGSLYSNMTGSGNSAFGHESLVNSTTASDNSAFGFQSLRSNTVGVNNCAFGVKSLYSGGNQNTAMGNYSLQNNTGSLNTAIGYNSGSTVTTGNNLTLVGNNANPSSPTATDQITLGNQLVSSLRCNVQTITSLSDARDKKYIQDLTLGLDFITKLKPRQFNWDRREWYEGGISDGSKIQETPTAGFIAQEFDEIQKSENVEWLNLVLKDNPDKWEATYGNLLPVMVKAIQELAAKNEELKLEKDEEVTKLKEEISFLKSEFERVSVTEEALTKVEHLKEELIQQINELKSIRKEYENKFSSLQN